MAIFWRWTILERFVDVSLLRNPATQRANPQRAPPSELATTDGNREESDSRGETGERQQERYSQELVMDRVRAPSRLAY